MRKTGSEVRFKTQPGEAGFRVVLRKYKWGASQRGLSFELTDEHVAALTKQRCHYCGAEPSAVAKSRARHETSAERTAYAYNGIDRKDPTIGYTPSNCVTCCATCNFAKQDLTHDQFLDLVKRIHNNLIQEAI